MTEIIPGLQGDIPADSRKGVPYVGGNNKVAACAKHFMGDGGTTKGINENNTVTDWHGVRVSFIKYYMVQGWSEGQFYKVLLYEVDAIHKVSCSMDLESHRSQLV